jgi:WD40 repeat protein
MKKLVVLLAAMALVLGIAGCASQGGGAVAAQGSAAVQSPGQEDSTGRGLELEALPEVPAEIAVFPQLGHVAGINSAVFSPDGKTIASGANDNTVKLWDIATGRELFTGRHSNSVKSVAFSPDGKAILSASFDKKLKLWDAATGREIRTFAGRSSGSESTTGHSSSVHSAAFSPDGRTIVSGGGDEEVFSFSLQDNTLRLWEAATGREIRVLAGHSSAVLSVAFSPDGKTIASGSMDKTVKLWDAAMGQELRAFTGHTDDVNSVVFSPDGKTIASGSKDWTVKLWDAATGREIHTLGNRNQFSSAAISVALAFSPDGKTIFSNSGLTLKLWDTATGREIRTITGHSNLIRSTAFSPDGKTILSADLGGSLKLWDAATGRELPGPSGHATNVDSVGFSPDGKTIVSGSSDTFKFWDATTGSLIRVLPGARGRGDTVSFSPDGKTISYGDRRDLELLDAVTGQELRSIAPEPVISSTTFSPDGRTIVTGFQGSSANLKLWGAATGQELRTLTGHTDSVGVVAFSPDGKTIVSGSGDKTMKLWDVATGREIRNFDRKDYPTSAAFSPDGKIIATCSYSEDPQLWDVATGREIRTLDGEKYFGSIDSISFSPDGKTVLGASSDNMLMLWDAATGKPLRAFAGHTDSVNSMAFSPDSKIILSGSSDGTVRLWDAATGKEIVQLVSFTGTDSQIAAATRGLTVETEAAASSIDSEWLAITPDGYFKASPLGDRYINVRVTTGTGDSAVTTITGIDAYRSVFYNPDVVQARIAGEPDPASKSSVTIQQAASFLPPEIALQSDAATTRAATANLSVTVTSSSQPVRNIKIIVNGRLLGRDELAAISGAKGLEAGRASLTVTGNQKTLSFRLPLALDPGTNNVEVVAFNGYTEGRRSLDITRNAPSGEKPPLPNLWILAVGVNRYQDSRINSLNYCANDAREIVARFKQQEGKRYAKVNSLLIADGEAQAPTAANIRKGLGFLGQAGPRDVILLFLAGHGINEGGSFHFLPGDAAYSADGKTLDTSRTISGTEITAVLEAPGNRLVFIDACQSGGVDSDRMVRALMDTNAFVFASSQGNEYSQERDEFRHGVFTYSILQQMGRGKRGGQEGLGMQQLSGDVQIEVPRITGNRQHPKSWSRGFHDFVISE